MLHLKCFLLVFAEEFGTISLNNSGEMLTRLLAIP